MARQEEKIEPVTFYVIRPDGESPAEWPTIYWPFSVITDWHTPVERQQSIVDQRKNVRFQNWYFTTSDKDQIWLLDHYNSGGTWDDPKWNPHFYPGEKILCKITREDPHAPKTRVIEKEIEKVVTKTVFPRTVIESMTPQQLVAICVSMKLDTSNVDHTVWALLKLLEDNGMIWD